VNKKKGETPLQVIEKIKKMNKDFQFLPMTYAGRLDPLAEGILIVLVGDEVYRKEEFLNLSKEYEVEILFGFSTDTYDILGKVLKNTNSQKSIFEKSSLDFVLKDFKGYFEQKYPLYSSRTVSGKPLWQWAREGKIEKIKIPSHKVYVENIEIIGDKKYLGDELLNIIKNNISLMKGDFRQEEILKTWQEKLKNQKNEIFYSVIIRVRCGSGVYMRSLSNDLGEKICIPALALNINRTKIGEYML